MYKAKLVGEKEAQPAPNNNVGILKNPAIALPIEYLNNFWISLEILLIYGKVQLKFKWTKHFVLDVAGVKNFHYFFLVSNTQSYMFRNYQKSLLKYLKDQCIGMNINKNSENKNLTNVYSIS